MPKILFVDEDPEMLNTMGTYLSWYGLDMEMLEDSSMVMRRLKEEEFSLLILSVFAKPAGAYELCGAIRKSGDAALRGINILLIAPEEPQFKEFLFLRRNNINLLTRYENSQVWYARINMILQKKKDRPHEENQIY